MVGFLFGLISGHLFVRAFWEGDVLIGMGGVVFFLIGVALQAHINRTRPK
jgi:hypothetical protein